MSRFARRRALITVLALALWVVAPPAANGGISPRSEITQTTAGRSIAAAARDRFAQYGTEFAADALRVFRLQDGSALVAPASYAADDFQVGADGSVRTTTGGRASLSTVTRSTGVALAATSWVRIAQHCFARSDIRTPNGNIGGFMDTCYEIYKLSGDPDSSYDYWNITTWATVDATRAYTIGDYAWIHVDRDGGGTWHWVDWSPHGDLSDNCGSRSLSISALGFGLGYGTTVCETWSLTKYSAAGELKIQWNGDSTGAREVAEMSAIKNNPGITPIWGISWNSVLKCRPQIVC
jgi:hypothetical protein